MAPEIQLPSIVIAHSFLPKPSPPQPAPIWFVSFIEPFFSIDLTKVNAFTFAALLMVAVFPSLERIQPPACSMKTPSRWNSGLVQRPTWPFRVSFLATAASWFHVFGRSLFVSFAPFQDAVLMMSASVEKSFGAAYRWPLYV